MRISYPPFVKGLVGLALISFLLTSCAVQTPQGAPVSTPGRVALVRTSYGNLSWLMPVSWQEVEPRIWAMPMGPYVFLSNARIIDPCPSSFRGAECMKPLKMLPIDGILVIFSGSAALQISKPKPVLNEIAVSQGCQDVGGAREVGTYYLGIAFAACLRGPHFTSNVALFQEMLSSMKRS